jgi:CP family cyanate transporter-like MFS transporter
MLAMMGGATVAAAVAVPLAGALGGWPRSLALWAGLALVGPDRVAPGRAAHQRARRTRTSTRRRPVGLPWRSAAAWTISGYLALQSTQFYSQLAWVAPYFTDRGSSATRPAAAGRLQRRADLLGHRRPALADRLHDRRPIVGAAVAANARD